MHIIKLGHYLSQGFSDNSDIIWFVWDTPRQLSALHWLQVGHCARWTMSKLKFFFAGRGGGTQTMSKLHIVRVRVTWTLSDLPPLPAKKNFNSDIVQLVQVKVTQTTEILPNLDIVWVRVTQITWTLSNLDIVWVGVTQITWTLSNLDIVWVGVTQTT